jgi:hypothetical protein
MQPAVEGVVWGQVAWGSLTTRRKLLHSLHLRLRLLLKKVLVLQQLLLQVVQLLLDLMELHVWLLQHYSLHASLRLRLPHLHLWLRLCLDHQV